MRELRKKVSARRARLQPCRKCLVQDPALAAEVRFWRYTQKQSHLCSAASQFSTQAIGKDVPQGLKPSSVTLLCGTAKPVPFVQRLFPQPVQSTAGTQDLFREL